MTGNSKSSPRESSTLGRLPSLGRRAGMARDRLIFVIICSVAIGVALVTVVLTIFSGPEAGAGTTWQCLQCDREFTIRTLQMPPIDCRKCDGQAVRTYYRSCPACRKRTILHRQRRTGQGPSGQEYSPGKPGSSGPMEFQYWVRQSDDSYAWSDWMQPLSARALRIKAGLRCQHCDAKLNPDSR